MCHQGCATKEYQGPQAIAGLLLLARRCRCDRSRCGACRPPRPRRGVSTSENGEGMPGSSKCAGRLLLPRKEGRAGLLDHRQEPWPGPFYQTRDQTHGASAPKTASAPLSEAAVEGSFITATRARRGSSARRRRRRVRQICHHRGLARRGRLVLAAITPFRIIRAVHVAAIGIEQRDDPCELARHQLSDLQGRARAWAEFV